MAYIYDDSHTYTGELVTFENEYGTSDITSLSVPVSPVQDLHGYASPWGPGGGNNLVKVAVVNNRVDAGITYTEDEFGTVHCSGTATAESFSAANVTAGTADQRCIRAIPAGTYTIANIGGARLWVQFRNEDNTANLATATNVAVGSSVTKTFSDPVIIYVRSDIASGTVVDDDMQVMVTAGSTAATVYEPYQNFCPITGSTSVSAYRTGKNLLPKSISTDGVYSGLTIKFNDDGSITLDGTTTGVVNICFPNYGYVFFVPSGNYILSGGVNGYVYMTFHDGVDSTGTRYNNTSNDTPVTITTGSVYNMRLVVLSGWTLSNLTIYPMLRPAGTNNTFAAPRNRDVYTANWSTQAGTVYGGTLDVVSGVLTVDMGNIPSYNGETINEPWLSSMDAYAPGTPPTIGAQVVYPLANTIEYQLTPSQIKLLTGQNNMWASNGESATAVVRDILHNFQGWLLKVGSNMTLVPTEMIKAETYKVTPNQRMEEQAERDSTGVLWRETVPNMPPKIEFNTPAAYDTDVNALNATFRAAYSNEQERKLTVAFYDPEENVYKSWECYMPNIDFPIRTIDIDAKTIFYDEIRYAFIGY